MFSNFSLGEGAFPGHQKCFEVLLNGQAIPGLYMTKILGMNGLDLEGFACHGPKIIASPITGQWHE